MLKQLSRSCTAMVLAGTMFSTQAAVMSDVSALFAEIPPPESITVFDPNGSVSFYALVPSDLVAMTEPDWSVAFFESPPSAIGDFNPAFGLSAYDLATSDQITVFNPDGSSWSYIPQTADLWTWYEPFEAAYVTDDDSLASTYVAYHVSSPSYSMSLE